MITVRMDSHKPVDDGMVSPEDGATHSFYMTFARARVTKSVGIENTCVALNLRSLHLGAIFITPRPFNVQEKVARPSPLGFRCSHKWDKYSCTHDRERYL